jgi:hypothetical protein
MTDCHTDREGGGGGEGVRREGGREGGRGRRKSQKVRGKMDIDMEWI